MRPACASSRNLLNASSFRTRMFVGRANFSQIKRHRNKKQGNSVPSSPNCRNYTLQLPRSKNKIELLIESRSNSNGKHHCVFTPQIFLKAILILTLVTICEHLWTKAHSPQSSIASYMLVRFRLSFPGMKSFWETLSSLPRLSHSKKFHPQDMIIRPRWPCASTFEQNMKSCPETVLAQRFQCPEQILTSIAGSPPLT